MEMLDGTVHQVLCVGEAQLQALQVFFVRLVVSAVAVTCASNSGQAASAPYLINDPAQASQPA
jgi:hypothetical protein